MASQYLPGAAWRPVSYRGQAGLFPARPRGEIVHVVVGNGSPWATFEYAPSGNRRFSTGWVAKSGYGEQYAELSTMSWAQMNGNPLYWSFETEGFPNERLTAAQIDTLARWHNAVGSPDAVTDNPGGLGIGTHAMGGAAYGGHTCPGPGPRAGQRIDIIRRARQLRGQPYTPPAPPVPHGKIVLAVDGALGPQTKMRIQQWAGASMDGVLGPQSWRAIQAKLGALTVDGNPGPLTWRRIQSVTGATVDGIPGPSTYSHWQTYLNAH